MGRPTDHRAVLCLGTRGLLRSPWPSGGTGPKWPTCRTARAQRTVRPQEKGEGRGRPRCLAHRVIADTGHVPFRPHGPCEGEKAPAEPEAALKPITTQTPKAMRSLDQKAGPRNPPPEVTSPGGTDRPPMDRGSAVCGEYEAPVAHAETSAPATTVHRRRAKRNVRLSVLRFEPTSPRLRPRVANHRATPHVASGGAAPQYLRRMSLVRSGPPCLRIPEDSESTGRRTEVYGRKRRRSAVDPMMHKASKGPVWPHHCPQAVFTATSAPSMFRAQDRGGRKRRKRMGSAVA